MLQLYHLQYFVALAETLHFGQAAARLHITQPALSQQIRNLEEILGVQLVERTRQTVQLTPAGQLFLKEARQALDQVDVAVRVAQRAAQGELGRLSVGFLGSVLYSFLPEVLRVFHERFPAVELKLRELNSTEQLVALIRQQIDIGVLYGPLHEPQLGLERVLQAPLWLALPRAHPLATRAVIALDELQREPFVLVSREYEPVLYDRWIGVCQQAGFVPRVVQEASQIQTILGLVAAGFGIFPAPAYVRHVPHVGVAYVPVAEPAPWIELYAVRRRRDGSPVLRNFLQVIRNVTGLLSPTA
jgi:DNA-binding transcriptional LysR family regulator